MHLDNEIIASFAYNITKLVKIIFFGIGSIGQRHANILRKHHRHELYAFRSGVNDEKNSLGIKEVYSWDEVKKLKPDIAFVTNPTHLHIDTAIKCAEIDCKLFIEKPIGKDLNGLDKLLKLVKQKNLVTYVAYNLRFHPVIAKLKEYTAKFKPLHTRVICTSFLPNWKPNTNYLKTYTANSKMGGGVILDLSHELDYVSYLLGHISKLDGNFSKRNNITVDAEDYADMLISTTLGPANVHINFLSHLNQRHIQIDFEDFTIIGDLNNAEIVEYKDYKLKKKLQFDYYRDLSYEQQLKYFFDNIDDPKMMNNLIEASILFKKIIEFKNG